MILTLPDFNFVLKISKVSVFNLIINYFTIDQIFFNSYPCIFIVAVATFSYKTIQDVQLQKL